MPSARTERVGSGRRKASGFTLIELLIVVAVIAILITLGLGAASFAAERGRAATCLASMRHFGTAVQMYVSDHNARLPNTSHVRAPDGSSLSWTVTLAEYLGSDFIGKCASNAKSPAAVTYAWNDCLTDAQGQGISLLACRTPASTLLLGETADGYLSEHFHFASSRTRITFNQFRTSAAVDRHDGFAHYLFVDGHVEALSPDSIRNRLNTTNSTFIKP